MGGKGRQCPDCTKQIEPTLRASLRVKRHESQYDRGKSNLSKRNCKALPQHTLFWNHCQLGRCPHWEVEGPTVGWEAPVPT